MLDQSLQKVLVDFNQEFLKVEVPEGAITFASPAPEALQSGMIASTPLLNICPPQVKAGDFFVTLHQVAGVIKKFMPDLAGELEQIEAALPAQPEQQELFVAAAFKPGTDLLSLLKQDLPAETFGFLLNHTVKPFMLQYALKAQSLYDLEQWLQGNCPVCGGKPTLSLLEKGTGKRQLFCGLCEIKWRFHRLGCPYCTNNESQFFTVEGMEKYRVYFCEKCRGYIKTVDENKAGGEPLNLLWEDINTVQLDVLAMREGYFNQQVDEPAPEHEK
ncbi:formate dehydrogenase accessory protein FdhE [Pelotomaculum propionicicum]|uniref:Protein FdhE n=1 Tax=Pelotomaculum propionicicum TaxID=258475 RepID=A0A4Y7RUU3_9FIRM|nr:formate dehydrogenase accessory protein FdhE [Pelotomaculum propionicicum]NLI13934.1 formate dehydrogenase accessory protein FdhE [Peptococcaceae bacterium]TEB12037.1 Protein FdhE [Pelotomaculum propionicicum]